MQQERRIRIVHDLFNVNKKNMLTTCYFNYGNTKQNSLLKKDLQA